MWVTNTALSPFFLFLFLIFKSSSSINTLLNSFIPLNSPLIRVYSTSPQDYRLATTTTYNYIKTPLRFRFLNIKDLQTIKSERRLSK